MNDTKKINLQQKEKYDELNSKLIQSYIQVYSEELSGYMANRNGPIRILDIGGGAGRFGVALKELFPYEFEIHVVDNTRYESWDELKSIINFHEKSAFEIQDMFETKYFDFIFAHHFFHHIVQGSYQKTTSGFFKLIQQIKHVLKEDGKLCIIDHFYDGILFHCATSRIIFKLTSSTNPLIVRICKKMRAQSAGIGVCYLTSSLWKNLLASAGFKVIYYYSKPKKMRLLRRIALLNKNYSDQYVLISQIN